MYIKKRRTREVQKKYTRRKMSNYWPTTKYDDKDKRKKKKKERKRKVKKRFSAKKKVSFKRIVKKKGKIRARVTGITDFWGVPARQRRDAEFEPESA